MVYPRYSLQHSIYAPEHQLDDADFALQTGIKCLNHLDKYFNLPYALSKIDMLALDAFKTGGMENWGLSTYRDNILIIDPDTTSVRNIENAVNGIAHEMAHMV